MAGWALALLAAAAPVPDAAHPSALVGLYDGGQMEMATGIQLTADGRFAWLLSYGALDERAQGTWAVRDGHVVLRGDPVTPPRFILVRQGPGAADRLTVTLETPQGMDPQYFSAVTDRPDDQTQFDPQGVARIALAPVAPRTVRLILPVAEVAGDPVPFDRTKGTALAFRFEPNDIGKADLRDVAMPIEGRDLLMERHGRTIRYRPVTPP